MLVSCDCVAVAGDKESFWMACELIGIPYTYVEGYASAIGNVTLDDMTRQTMLCPCHLLHLDHRGKPLWYNGSLYRNKHVEKASQQWFQPMVWAKDTGRWRHVHCMLDVDAHGGAHNLSEAGIDVLYERMVQEAVTVNALI